MEVKWATTFREDSDKSAHSQSLNRIFTGRIIDSQEYKVFSCRQKKKQKKNKKTLIILYGRAGWYESCFAHISKAFFLELGFK